MRHCSPFASIMPTQKAIATIRFKSTRNSDHLKNSPPEYGCAMMRSWSRP